VREKEKLRAALHGKNERYFQLVRFVTQGHNFAGQDTISLQTMTLMCLIRTLQERSLFTLSILVFIFTTCAHHRYQEYMKKTRRIKNRRRKAEEEKEENVGERKTENEQI
jgi:hypothetical protein